MKLIDLLNTMSKPEDVIYVQGDHDAYNEYNPLPNEYLHMEVVKWDYHDGPIGDILQVDLTDTPFREVMLTEDDYVRILDRAVDMKKSIPEYLDWALTRLYSPLTVMDILDILPGYTVKLQRGDTIHYADWMHLPDEWCDIPIDVLEVDKHGYLTIVLDRTSDRILKGEKHGNEEGDSQTRRLRAGHLAPLIYPERPVRVPKDSGEKGEPEAGAPGAGKEQHNGRVPFWRRRK